MLTKTLYLQFISVQGPPTAPHVSRQVTEYVTGLEEGEKPPRRLVLVSWEQERGVYAGIDMAVYGFPTGNSATAEVWGLGFQNKVWNQLESAKLKDPLQTHGNSQLWVICIKYDLAVLGLMLIITIVIIMEADNPCLEPTQYIYSESENLCVRIQINKWSNLTKCNLLKYCSEVQYWGTWTSLGYFHLLLLDYILKINNRLFTLQHLTPLHFSHFAVLCIEWLLLLMCNQSDYVVGGTLSTLEWLTAIEGLDPDNGSVPVVQLQSLTVLREMSPSSVNSQFCVWWALKVSRFATYLCKLCIWPWLALN